MLPVWNDGGPVSADAGDAACRARAAGTPLAFAGPSTLIDGALLVTNDRRHRRRARADQVLVVQERAAERALEEVVGQHVLLRQRVELGLAVVEVAHGQAARVEPGGEHVVRAAVDLHDVLEESVGQVARDVQRGQRRRAVGDEAGLDRERRVGQVVALRLGHDGRVARPASRRPRSAAASAARWSRRDPSAGCRPRSAGRWRRRPRSRPCAPGKLPNRLSKVRFSA